MTNEEAIKWVYDRMCFGRGTFTKNHPPNIDECWEAGGMAIKALERTGWIPVSERLPEELEEVIVTWVNHNPPVYYRHEKDKPQTGIAVLYRDTWHWWDSTIVDVLAEYGSRCEIEHISEDIEIIAWQPLPESYRPEGENK